MSFFTVKWAEGRKVYSDKDRAKAVWSKQECLDMWKAQREKGKTDEQILNALSKWTGEHEQDPMMQKYSMDCFKVFEQVYDKCKDDIDSMITKTKPKKSLFSKGLTDG